MTVKAATYSPHANGPLSKTRDLAVQERRPQQEHGAPGKLRDAQTRQGATRANEPPSIPRWSRTNQMIDIIEPEQQREMSPLQRRERKLLRRNVWLPDRSFMAPARCAVTS